MQRLMLRLDAVVRRHRRLVIAAWVLALLAAVPFALQQGEHLTGGGFGVPGSQSKAVEERLERQFPGAARGTLAAVVVPQTGATVADVRRTVDEVAAAAGRADRVELTAPAREAALRAATGTPGRPVLLPLAVETDDLGTTDVAKALREDLGIADRSEDAAVGLHLIGQGALWASLQELSTEDLKAAEQTGFPIVALILLGVFGSLAAAALPLALGAFSVLTTGALIYLLSQQMEMSVFVTSMASMIGIGVAVDYSLFVLARYREELDRGVPPERARATAMATSGLAVVFSGLTVVVALAGLFLVPTTAIRSMALGAILVVLVSMLASATLLPALMSALGHRVHLRGRVFVALDRRVRLLRRRRAGDPGFWPRWTGRVMRRPAISAVAATALLVLLAVPAVDLETGNGALRQFPAGHETVRGFEAAASLGGRGDGAPVRVVVPAGDAGRAQEALRAEQLVARVAPPVRSVDGREVLLVATLRVDGEAREAKGAVDRLRDALPSAQVGGASALLRDFGDTVAGSMWKIALFVLVLSFLVLLVLLRSVVLPVKAAVMNLLSVGAAYGVLVIVFQWGWLDGLLGWESPGYIDALTPPLILAVVFGLSMDYEVFLLSRIRERFTATGDTRTAVAEGLSASARTITSAALIMVAVFAVFVFTGVPSIKQIGLGNAVAIAVDATVVRLVLVPAAMELLGSWNWYLPRWLDRRLPAVELEELVAALEAAGERRDERALQPA
jgi:uncharacterized membrane protein YdfJ with MMPL/SSD domain